ncbi:hypothetical protein DFH28DRAFT_1118490 [Melampsora americana]|nr:hypothetical protein DFH28DRAFT_1118490 [Melampsora americana]
MPFGCVLWPLLFNAERASNPIQSQLLMQSSRYSLRFAPVTLMSQMWYMLHLNEPKFTDEAFSDDENLGMLLSRSRGDKQPFGSLHDDNTRGNRNRTSNLKKAAPAMRLTKWSPSRCISRQALQSFHLGTCSVSLSFCNSIFVP